MSGAEAAGLVLGVIPLLIGALEHYESVLACVSKYQKFSSKVRNLHDALSLEGTIFRAECVLLLSPNIDKSEAQKMLEDLSHPSWRDETFNQRMDQCFGSLGHAMHEVTGRMVATLNKVALKIEEFDLAANDASKMAQPSSKKWHSTVKAKLKFALSSHASIAKDLEELVKLNERFAMLSSKIRQLEKRWTPSTSDVPSQPSQHQGLKTFVQTRLASLDLHSTFLGSCPAVHEHFLRFGLNDPGLQRKRTESKSGIMFNIHYCGRHTEGGPTCVPRDALKGDQSHHKQQPEHQLLIESTISSNSATASALSESDITSKLRSPSKLPGEQCIATANKQVSLQVHPNDLCSQLEKVQSQPPSSGSDQIPLKLPGKAGFDHIIVSNSLDLQSQRTISLANLLTLIKQRGRHLEIPCYQRLGIAETLGTRVLQMHNTPWLAQSLDSHGLYFFGEPSQMPRNTRFGHTQIKPGAIYVDVRLEPETMRLSEQTSSAVSDAAVQSPQSRFGLQSGPPNSWLYNLGVLLIELAYHTPFTDLVAEIKQEYETLSIPLSANACTAEYQIACQLADNVGSSLGAGYAGIVRRCLRCEFGAMSTDLDDKILQQSVYQEVVCKLQDLEEGFRALQVDSTA